LRVVSIAGRRLSPLATVGILAGAAAALRFAGAVQMRSPLLYPDEYIHTALARSIVDGTFPHVRGGSVSFFSYLGPLLMAPAWVIQDVDVAYRVAQALGCIAFATAAFPAYLLARRLGVRPNGAVAAALLTLVGSNGVWSGDLMAEPYAYALFVVAVLVGTEAIAHPTAWRQVAVVACALGLPLVGGAQFATFGVAYLPAALLGGPRWSLRAFAREQWVVLAAVAAGAVAAAIAIASGSRLRITWETATISFNYPLVESAQWFGVNLFVFAIGCGWVIVPLAAVGLWRLVASIEARQRAFGTLSVILIALQLAEATPFGVNVDTVLERYAFYGAPLVAVAFAWAVQELRPGRALAAVAYAAAAAALLLPVVPPLLAADVTESATLRGLAELETDALPAVAIWGPALTLLAAATAWRRVARERALVAVAVAVCVFISVGASRHFVGKTRENEAFRADTRDDAAFVTWAGSDALDLMRTLFWNRNLERVLILGPGGSSDGFPYRSATVGPGGAVLAAAGGGRLTGPYVFGPDTVVAQRGARWTRRRQALAVEEKAPPLVALGWDARTGIVGPAGRILAAAGARPARSRRAAEEPRRQAEDVPVRVPARRRYARSSSPGGAPPPRFPCRRGPCSPAASASASARPDSSPAVRRASRAR